MKIRFGDVGDSSTSRAQKIRALFVADRTVEAHTAICVAAKLWSESELTAKAERACKEEVRDALGVLLDGLPFAAPMPPRGKGKKPQWRQYELWSKPECLHVFDAYARRGGENIAIANNVADFTWKRYGDGPKRLEIVEIGDEPTEEL